MNGVYPSMHKHSVEYFLQVGYLYGQYKRINDHIAQRGRGVLWGGTHFYPEVCIPAF